MDLEGIKSEDMSVASLFKEFYIVPDYQREYVWETEQVEKLLNDVYLEFERRGDDSSPDYFVGTIVTNFQSGTKIFELIDGQQRITTFYVILCAIRDYMRDADDPIEGIKEQLYASKNDAFGNESFEYRVELQYPDSQNVLEHLVEDRDTRPIDTIDTSTKSAKNIVQAYKDILSFLASSLEGDPRSFVTSGLTSRDR